jgi:hypothetical protein
VKVRALEDLAALGVPISEVVPPTGDPEAAAAAGAGEDLDADQLRAEIDRLVQENATERDGKAVMKRARQISTLRAQLETLERAAA